MTTNASLQMAEHPGVILKEELTARKIKQKEFAKRIGLQESHLSEIIKGKRPITKKISIDLERELGIPSLFWVNIQMQFDNEQTELELLGQNEIESKKQLRLFDTIIDIKTLLKRCELQNQTASTQWDFCRNTLNFTTPETYLNQMGRYRRSEKTGMDLRMIYTWTTIARYKISSIKPKGIYDPNINEEMCTELVRIFHENTDTIVRLTNIFSKYGIKFHVVEKVEHASIDGYSFIDNENIPVIIVTKRYDRIDNLAFSVMHEVGHLILGHLKDTTQIFVNIPTDDDEIAAIEDAANAFASNALISDELWENVPPVKPTPFQIQKDYNEWALQHHLNKWIVLGRLSYETGMYKFNSDDTRTIA